MSDFRISHISDRELAKWVRSSPSIAKEFIAERGGKPTLRRMDDPPHKMMVEYFWFDGGIYRREGPKGRPESRRWERYSERPLNGDNPWWFWKDVSMELGSSLDALYTEGGGVNLN